MSFILWLVVWFVPFVALYYNGKIEKAAVREFLDGFIMIVTIMLFFSPLYYEFPSWDATVVTFNDGRVIKHRYGTFGWEFSSKNTWANMPDEQFNGSTVVPITDNPKVRKVTYLVKETILDPQKFYSPIRDKADRFYTLRSGRADLGGIGRKGIIEPPLNKSYFGVYSEMLWLVSFQLYEFNNANSKQIAEFYNPLDAEQNKKFKELLENDVNPRLEPNGLKVEFISFDVE